MRGFFEEFKKFILRGNVVDLAVGIVIGAAFAKVVDSLVKDVFMPVIGVLTGGDSLSGMRIHLYGDAYITWGVFLQAVINFVIIGFCLFLVVKGMNSMHKRLGKEEPVPAPTPTETEKLLAEIRDLLKAKATT
jgi:large conductance mechanosensitive channel